jgi:magnesium-transporting ATPase (P-type)
VYGERQGDPDPNETLENLEGMAKSGINAVKAKLREESKRYYKNIRNPKIKDSIYDYPYMNFVRVLALCHTVVCDIDVLTKEIRYQASSPDELALASGAK